MSELFEIIKSVTTTKKRIEFDQKSYPAWMVNHGLSYHADTVLFANEMNKAYKLPADMQYDFLFHTIRKRKRPFVKWIKQAQDSDIEMLQTLYGYSIQKAKEALSVLTQEQLAQLRELTFRGGKSKP